MLIREDIKIRGDIVADGLIEAYTVIASDLDDPIMMRLEVFADREKMRSFLEKYAKEHKRCIIIAGLVDDTDYQVEYEEDQETIKSIHFEDEPGYKPAFGLFEVKNGQLVGSDE